MQQAAALRTVTARRVAGEEAKAAETHERRGAIAAASCPSRTILSSATAGAVHRSRIFCRGGR